LFPLVVIHRKIYLFLAEPAEPVTPPHFDPQHLTIVVQNLEGRGKKGILVDDTANELFFRVQDLEGGRGLLTEKKGTRTTGFLLQFQNE